ncbi:hypothetical protein acdb102_31370 [Acidothermaceae bacterium B102]|nr:hypothetical protein acdb102_31370 [Acidothermaceae bacterium B102]
MEEHRSVLLVTGSGATASLGVGGSSIPQMGAWVESLIADVNAAVPGAAERIGLVSGLPPEEFERTLGDFLAYHRSLEFVRTFGRMACEADTSLGYISPNDVPESKFNAWVDTAQSQTKAIVAAIHRNLYENFSVDKLDDHKCRAAYQGLVDRLVEPDSYLAIATTNYDVSAEIGLNGWTTKSGRIIGTRTGLERRNPYTAERLEQSAVAQMRDDFAGASGNFPVPVMYLHGAVGWYWEDGEIRVPSARNQPFDPSREPAILLPDDRKTAGSLRGGEGLWDQFQLISRAATHIGFMGHSLHDRHLLAVVNDAVGSFPKKLAVFWYEGSAGDDLNTKSATHVKEWDREYIKNVLPGAEIILCRFGEKPIFDEPALRAWLT